MGTVDKPELAKSLKINSIETIEISDDETIEVRASVNAPIIGVQEDVDEVIGEEDEWETDDSDNESLLLDIINADHDTEINDLGKHTRRFGDHFA